MKDDMIDGLLSALRATSFRRAWATQAANAIDALRAERDAAIRRAKAAEEALSFYANPETYFAVAFWFDPPTGGFEDDFDEDYGEWTGLDFDRPMPGKTARAALRSAALAERDQP